MKSSAALFALCAALNGLVARAQQGFTNPSPDVPDMDPSLTIVQGEVVRFTWSANATYQPTLDGQPIMGSDGRASLWLTSFEGDENRFGKLLSASVISAGQAAWAYKVDLSDAEIDRWKGRFNYRLMKPVSSPSAAFVDSRNVVSSRGFIIRKKSDVAASLASVSASYARAAATSQSSSAGAPTTLSTQSTPATASASTTAGAAPTGSASNNATPGGTSSESTSNGSKSSENASSGGLSTGAKAGIAVGCIAIAIMGAIAVLLFLRHRRRSQASPNPYDNAHLHEKSTPELQPAVYRHEVPGTSHEAYEMPAQQENEYKAELSGTHGKP